MTTLKKRNGIRNLPSLFDDLMPDFSTSLMNQEAMPAVNIRETKDQYWLEVAAPGMSKKDFDVSLENNTLHIRGKKEDRKDEQKADGEYTRQEFSYREFNRIFNLPADTVETEKIAAEYKDGILHIRIPKLKDAQVTRSKRIEIS